MIFMFKEVPVLCCIGINYKVARILSGLEVMPPWSNSLHHKTVLLKNAHENFRLPEHSITQKFHIKDFFTKALYYRTYIIIIRNRIESSIVFCDIVVAHYLIRQRYFLFGVFNFYFHIKSHFVL